MPVRSPDPGTFEHLLQLVEVPVAELVRLTSRPETEVWWSHGLYRFDGPDKDDIEGVKQSGEPFGTSYAGLGIDPAFCESVIHENSWFHNGMFQVSKEALAARLQMSYERPQSPMLRLADFTGKALKALGLNNDISSGEDYTTSMAWARAVHGADKKWDGILYVSRQLNTGLCVALFERSAVRPGSVRKLPPELVKSLCTRFHVLPITLTTPEQLEAAEAAEEAEEVEARKAAASADEPSSLIARQLPAVPDAPDAPDAPGEAGVSGGSGN